MKELFDADEMAGLLGELAAKIAAEISDGASVALVGIRSRGDTIAQRLQQILRDGHGMEVERGTLDITLYRDDLNQVGHQQPQVRASEIDFNIDDRVIVLVDDVLNTGRSVRAALDALIDYGRPRAIRLAVLVDRGHRELPIRADYVGREVTVPNNVRVYVCLREVDDSEHIILE